MKTILEINNEEISVSEFMLNYNLDKENTIDVVMENKAFLNILKEYGIVESTSYNMFLSELKKENKRRLEAKKIAEQVRQDILEETFTESENFYRNKYEFTYSNKSYDENYNAEIKEVALGLEVGDISNIVEFNGGYHILKCLNSIEICSLCMRH